MRGLHLRSIVKTLPLWNLLQLSIEIDGNSPLMSPTEVKATKELPKRTCLWPSNKLHSWVRCDSFPMVYLACQVSSLRRTTLPSWNLLQMRKLTMVPIYRLCTHAVVIRDLWHRMSPQTLYGHMHEWASVHSAFRYNSILGVRSLWTRCAQC